MVKRILKFIYINTSQKMNISEFSNILNLSSNSVTF